MSSSISLPVCNGCKRHIMPGDKNVKFNCPECNAELIWRCRSCREAATAYTCKSCGFSGP
jgi:hypothetical protein